MGSLAVSAGLCLAGLPIFFMLFLIPLIPFLAKKQKQKYCPLCGWSASGDEIYCPYDKTLLVVKDEN
ncbi:MAG: hypothetical protein PHO78_02805 [Methanomicrobium sp.]|nr:hypothetical protein [Methanomicrobium sp.]